MAPGRKLKPTTRRLLRRRLGRQFSILVALTVITLTVAIGGYLAVHHSRAATSLSVGFHYGFDFSDQEPDPATQDSQDANNVPSAVASAKQVLSSFNGSVMDQSIYGFGASNDPEPSVGAFDTSSITPRINLITNAGGIPVMTLVGAPAWMYAQTGCDSDVSDGFFTPPCPSHYQDFADLAAHIAQSYPQIKYFIVWNEFKGFYTGTGALDYTNYTLMYNDVYAAIKKVRPDAQVGGPYAPFSAFPCQGSGSGYVLHGSWGCINNSVVDAFNYWLANNHGADFVAIDGATEIAKTNNPKLTDPVTASEKYAAVDQWIKSKTSMPIWWMESHIAPFGWSFAEGAAVRIATLILMNSSGASVGMQWQPQEQTQNLQGQPVVWPDEGLWTTTQVAGGGQPTPLATELESALPVLTEPLSLEASEPTGVLVATSQLGSILVNTMAATAVAKLGANNVTLTPFQVLVEPHTTTPPVTPTPTVSPDPTPSPPSGSSPSPTPGAPPGTSPGPENGSTGNLAVGPPGSQISVDGVAAGDSGSLDTTYLDNGLHTIAVKSDGRTTKETIDVHNKLNFFEWLRNILFSRFTQNHVLMNTGTILVLGLPIVIVALLWRRQIAYLVTSKFERRTALK